MTRKTCTAPNCKEKIPRTNYFCAECFKALPSSVKQDLMESRKWGDGKKLMASLETARQMLGATA